MKGTGKLSGAVMQIAFILTALHFQSLISAPAMTSVSYFLCPIFYPSPRLLQPFHFFPLFNVIFSHFHLPLPIFPLNEYPSIYISL